MATRRPIRSRQEIVIFGEMLGYKYNLYGRGGDIRMAKKVKVSKPKTVKSTKKGKKSTK